MHVVRCARKPRALTTSARPPICLKRNSIKLPANSYATQLLSGLPLTPIRCVHEDVDAGAARVAPARIPAKHQSLLHLAG
jgi:hypothetical protein